MWGRSHQSAPRCATRKAGRRMQIRALALAGVTASAVSLAGAAQAGDADTVAIAVTSASGVTATSAMVAELAALQSAYTAAAAAAPAPDPFEDMRFETIPRELSSLDRPSLDREGQLPTQTVAAPPVLMLAQPELGPLVIEQPVRVYENDVTVKLSAPGRRRSFATVEVTF